MCYNKCMIKLITTDSYFNVFNILAERLVGPNQLQGKNLVFCEEKVSLMLERAICQKFNGTFNTEVYSFGNYLRTKYPNPNVLTREGSAMVIKKVLSETPLSCFKASKLSLAPSLFELIILLKSANVWVEDIVSCAQKTKGILQNKLNDVANVYSAYEDYLRKNMIEDQSSMLSVLPTVFENDPKLPYTDVFLVGFSSLTSQARQGVLSLLKKAKSVTAILVEGENNFAYLNETVSQFRNLCKQNSYDLKEERVQSSFCSEAKIIVNNLFNPINKIQKTQTENIYISTPNTTYDEIERVAFTIKQGVINGDMRYKDSSIALADASIYQEQIKEVFTRLEIPYFIDQKIKPSNHPLVLLLLSYIDLFRKGFEKNNLCAFFKNPLFCSDKKFVQKFENYLKKYNLFYSAFKSPFEFSAENDEQLAQFEQFRKDIVALFARFEPNALLEKLEIKDKLCEYSKQLLKLNKAEESAVSEQIYDAVNGILSEISSLLGGINLTYLEYRNIFVSGITALELSIIPQYNDAVFIGGYKEISLYPSKQLFAVGLTSAVPNAKADVSLLSDNDIEALEQFKVMIEPKVKVVNKREKESVALGISAFTDKLFISYPLTSNSGTNNAKGEVYAFIEKAFSTKTTPSIDAYFTKKQANLSFAKACSDFYEGTIDSLENASAYYYYSKDKEQLTDLATQTTKKPKIYLEEYKQAVIKNAISPTSIEEYYRCPYKAFLSHGLRLYPLDEGKVDGLSYGNLMHEIFAKFIENISSVSDKNSCDLLFENLSKQVLQNQRYKKFLKDDANLSAIERALEECKTFCYKNFLMSQNSKFKTEKENIEVPFGIKKEGKKTYPAISLLDGKVKLSGVIDRVDTFEDYCRIIDYKTGSADASCEKLFAGLKLQLYLYANAVNDKKVAGVYYQPISDEYKEEENKSKSLFVGKTLNEESIILGQDLSLKENDQSEFLPVSRNQKGEMVGATSTENLQAMQKYALALSEKAVLQMQQGVIVSSPYEKTCDTCPYIAMCQKEEFSPRKVRTIHEDAFYTALQGGKDND